jgi:hypothetical protein
VKFSASLSISAKIFHASAKVCRSKFKDGKFPDLLCFDAFPAMNRDKELR